MADRKKPTRKSLKPDQTRGEAPAEYERCRDYALSMVRDVTRKGSCGRSMSPQAVLSELRPRVDVAGLDPVDMCREASSALIDKFAKPVRDVARTLSTYREDERRWIDSNARGLVRRMSASPEPLVVLESKTAVGEDEVVASMAQACAAGVGPAFLRGRVLKRAIVDFSGALDELSMGMDDDEDSYDYRRPDGAYRLWCCMYSCFDDGKSVILFEEPAALTTLASAKPMMCPSVVMAKTDSGSDYGLDSYEFLFRDMSQFYELHPNESADLNAKFLYRKLASSRYWLDRYGFKVTQGIVLAMCRASAQWWPADEYDPKSVIDLIVDYYADCCFAGAQPSPRDARGWLADKYAVPEKALTEPAVFEATDQDAADAGSQPAGLTARERAALAHPAANPPLPPLPPRPADQEHGSNATTPHCGRASFKFKTRGELAESLKSRVIGQDAALEEVMKPVIRYEAGLSDERKPIASLLLAGPSGVGKTETARALAVACFGSEEYLKRIDCSELHDAISVNKLLGSAQGYVGYDAGGDLLNWVQEKKRGVLLLDEIEKADPAIYDSILLPLLDYGVLSGPVKISTETTAPDGSRQKVSKTKVMDVDCRQLIIIMTSNLGSKSVSARGVSRMGFSQCEPDVDAELEADVESALDKEFRPELRNRIGRVIIYKPLSVESLERIFALKWGVVDSKAKLRGMDVELGPGVARWFVDHARADNYGARPIERMIDEKLSDPLADLILAEAEDARLRVAVDCDQASAAGGHSAGGVLAAGFPRRVDHRTVIKVSVIGDDLDIRPLDEA